MERGGGGLPAAVSGRIGISLNMSVEYRGEGEELQFFVGEKWVSPLQISDLPLEEGERVCAWVARQFLGMSESGSSVIPLPELFLKPSFQRDRVCFYGGSFNPWHPGHRACLELCPEKNILVVPDCNPWKSFREEHRNWDYYLKLCYTLENTTYSVYPGLLYAVADATVDWLPSTDFGEKSLLMGADNFLALDRWKDYPRLIQSLNRLYVVPRGEGEYQKMTQHLMEINPLLEITILPRHRYEDLASSGLRAQD